MTDQRGLRTLIFAPGFSTADVVTDVSRAAASAWTWSRRTSPSLGGTVEIDSAEGYGMSVKVRLPLTLAIMDGMSIGVGDEVLHPAAGLRRWNRSRSPRAHHQDRSAAPAAWSRCATSSCPSSTSKARLRGAALRLRARRATSWSSSRPRAPAWPCWSTNLLGQQQVVVKNLEANYRKVAGRVRRHDHGRRPRGPDPRCRQPGEAITPLNEAFRSSSVADCCGYS